VSARSVRLFRERYGPWALVAGASEGLGAAFARALAARGLHLVLCARRSAPLERFSRELAQTHRVEVRPVALDLGSPESAARIEALTASLDLGLLVYNAALSPLAEFLQLSVAEHEEILRVNCLAPLELAHRLGRRLVARGRGGILLMSSLAGLHGTALCAHYAATRAYNHVLAEGLWAELRERGVDVLACLAGATRTPGFERSRPRSGLISAPVMEPEAVVGEALAALGRRPSLVPGLANRLAAALMSRVLPRRYAVLLMSRTTRQMYE
jgi:short-subunit dehydrogenase